MTSGRVLVVDDDPIGRLITTTQLEELGHEVLAVDNGAAAVDAVAAGGIDLVMMDRQMPVMDGCETARRIRALGDPAAAGVPIVALSAGDDLSARRECAEAGMNDYLVKPVEPAVLAACVGGLLPTENDGSAAPGGGRDAEAAEIRAALAKLEIAVGGRATVELAITRFLEEVPGWLEAIAGDDLHVRSRTAHTLKGASRSLGANEVGRLAGSAEERPERDVSSELAAAVARAERAFRDYLSEPSART